MLSLRSAIDGGENAISRALAKRRDAGQPVLDLTVANPTRAGIPYDERAVLEAFADARMLDYAPEPFGLGFAREAVAADWTKHGVPIEASRVVLTASTSEAYAFLFKLLCDPGDEVLVPQPSYPLFDHLARFESVKLVPYPLAYDGAWHVDVPSLERAITPRTRAVIVVSPNNPTGSFLKKDELAALARTRLPILSDEVFARYALKPDARRVVSALEVGEGAPLVFALNGLSKLAALPQMKCAWMGVGGETRAVNDALARLELIADSFLSVGTPVQRALPKLLDARGLAEGAIVRRTKRNLDAVREAVRGSAATLLDVEGGWYATLRLPRTHAGGEEAWVLELLERDGVYVHPGHFFDFAEEPYVIVSLLTPEADLDQGIAAIVSGANAG